jgi:KUP system potassium uptake protein
MHDEPTVSGPATPDRAPVELHASAAKSTSNPAAEKEASKAPQGHGAKGNLWALALAALGVVYGDIGTSPLYSLRECFSGHHGLALTPSNVHGLLSLVFWSLMLVVSAKYLQYVMRADDDGEGGILALMALSAKPALGRVASRFVVVLGLFGAGLLFGDGIITPAISVLSAVEGLGIVAPSLDRFVVPLTVVIIVGLFWVQKSGTEKVGTWFGPIIVIWFITLAVLGTAQIRHHPTVLFALDPRHAISFFVRNRMVGFLTLGSVLLVVTGGEALYADMGHFGLKPIRVTWYGMVLPSLLLNYFGQGALLLEHPAAIEHPFYGLAPRWALLPMVLLSTAATIIASQAVISGVFSITRQASMLGYWPRVNIRHTSADLMGQIYVPSVNWVMLGCTVFVVLGFRASSDLAAAYGIAVTGTMTITTLLSAVVARRRWHWPWLIVLVVSAIFLFVDLSFLGANLVKIAHGGWLPLSIAACVYIMMTSWKRGRELLGNRVRENLVPLEDFWELLRVERPSRVPGTAVFMTSNREGTPPALLFNFVHNHVVHEHVVLLTVMTLPSARVSPEQRLIVETLREGFVRIVGKYGFMETPDVPALMKAAALPGVAAEHTTYFLGREAVVTEHRWTSIRLYLFSMLARNASSATDFFNIPPDRMMEIGSQVRL